MENGLVVVACPACGGLEVLIVPSQVGVQVRCRCGVSGPYGNGEEAVQEAVRNWSRMQYDRKPRIETASSLGALGE